MTEKKKETTKEVKVVGDLNVLAKIQSLMKVAKSQRNTFGKYNYRSAEDILEEAKRVCNPLGFSVTCTDEVVLIGDRYYVMAQASIQNPETEQFFMARGFAREEESKKGMDGSQVTGASSSYARKYAMNGLFAIDDTKDSDHTNEHGKEEVKKTYQRSDDAGKTEKKPKPLPADKIEMAVQFIVGGKKMSDIKKSYSITAEQEKAINAGVKLKQEAAKAESK